MRPMSVRARAKILIVDDEADARDLLLRGLERLGYEGHAARDGSAASEMLDGSFDVVVTDLVMPRLDGIGLLREVVVRNPRAVRVVITSFADKERVLAAFNLGAHYLIEKPFTTQQLGEVLARLLVERSEQDGEDLTGIFKRRLAAMALLERERQLIVYVLKGLPNKEVASLLGIGEQSVKNALYLLYQKLGVSSRSELFHLVFPI
jgi:DNA-binding NarL/FixJ family response regulator